MTGERQVPFYCPYCGEENLRPDGAEAGGWQCRACARGFSLRFVGLTALREPSARPEPSPSWSQS